MRLPKHLFFHRQPAAPALPLPHPPLSPPPAHAPPAYPSSSPDLVRTGFEQDAGVRVTTTEEGQTAVIVEDPNLVAMFLEDYQRTRVYIRELEWKVAMRKALRRNLYKWYALALVLITISVLLSTKHEDIVTFCNPITKRIRSWPGGWLIPIALLIIVSFPPLMGHEIIGILCGLVWGFGEGFGILAAGTFAGESALWVAFKWMCTARAAKFEKKNKLYSALTQLIREKSFMFMLILRFSAVPGHITTAVSASAGASFWAYLAAAFLTLPKQLTIAYLGTAFGQHSRKDTIISVATTLLTLLATVIAAVYIYYQMRLIIRRQPTLVPALPTHMQEVQALHIDISEATLGRRAAEAATKSAPHDKDTYSDLQARKPWLFGGRTMGEDGLGRARSLPGPFSDRQARWLADLELGAQPAEPEGRSDTPMIRLDDAKGESSRSRSPDVFDCRAATPSPPRMNTAATDDYTPRGTMSLDLPRERADRLGGREIADDADLFAVSRGAMRPDYGRLRGESRAALLGRPEWEDRSDAGSERSWSAMSTKEVSASPERRGIGMLGPDSAKKAPRRPFHGSTDQIDRGVGGSVLVTTAESKVEDEI